MKKTFFSVWCSLLFLFPLSSSAMVHVSPGFTGAGFRLSLIVPEWYDVGFGVGGHADIRILPVLHFYPSFEYSHAGSGVYSDDWINGVHFYRHLYLNEFAMNADLRFYPPFSNLIINPFAGGGLAFVVSNEYSSYVGVTDDNNRWHSSVNDPGPALDLLLGLDFPVGSTTGTVEMKVKVGTGYTIFKVTGGLTFPVSLSLMKK
jgi:hypothetical protein